MSNWLRIQIEAVDAIGKAEPLEYLQIAWEPMWFSAHAYFGTMNIRGF